MSMTKPELQLQSAIPARPVEPGAVVRAGTLTSIAPFEDRTRLARELDHYLGRLAELDKLDPYDFTGLKRVFGEHVRRTRDELDRLDP